MKMTQGDHNVVSNLRYEYKDKLLTYSDEVIAEAWREFSISDEYPSKDKPEVFLDWVEMIREEGQPQKGDRT